MTDEGKANLLRAYRLAIEAGQDGIADMLEDVILAEMCAVPAIIGSRTTTEPPWTTTEPLWSVLRGPDVLDVKMQCTGIDPMSKEES
jgi:hypothetical protein